MLREEMKWVEKVAAEIARVEIDKAVAALRLEFAEFRKEIFAPPTVAEKPGAHAAPKEEIDAKL
jgi:hypothetical protein